MRRRLLFLALIGLLLLALLPAAAAAAPLQSNPVYHRVQRGEYLSRIARRYGVSMYAIARANGISNLNLIYVGQVLVIPYGPSPTPSPSCTHIVRRGEWLSTIARRYGVSWRALAQTNGISNPNRIYPGQRLVIPGCAPSPPPPPPPPPPWPPWPGPGPQPIQCEITPVMGFGRVWTNNTSVRQKLGCPQAQEFSVEGAEQHFQNGIVIWRGDQEDVTVLYRNGSWGTLPDPWDDCQCYNPLTPYVGWPSTNRWEGQVSVQDFAGGTMLWTPCSGIYVLYDDGTWSHYI